MKEILFLMYVSLLKSQIGEYEQRLGERGFLSKV